jgi:hypothetical protein
MLKASLFFFVFFLVSFPVYACSFDTDCSVGSKCSKTPGQIYGVCVGGMFPGNKNDSRPAKFFPDITQSHGNTCSFDTDCGVGGKCNKRVGQLYGVCR